MYKFIFCTLFLHVAPFLFVDGKNVETNKTVIIIGAGASGLAAATELIKAGGFSVTVLEAGDYIGGRISSQQVGEHFVEFGATYVHGEEGNSVYKLVAPYGFLMSQNETTDEPEDADEVEKEEILDEIYATQYGEVMNSSLAFKMQVVEVVFNARDDKESPELSTFYNMTRALFKNTPAGKNASFGEFAKILFQKFDAHLRLPVRESIKAAILDMTQVDTCIYNGCDNWFELSDSDEGEQYEIAEGNQGISWKSPATYSTFLKVLLGQPTSGSTNADIKRPDWLQFSKEVVGINYSDMNDGDVSVTCKDGSVYKAAHVLSTVSLGVLKEKHSDLFNPTLSEKKRLAIEYIGFGTVDKIYLEFERAWWLGPHVNHTGFTTLWENKDEKVSKNFRLSSDSTELAKEDENGIPKWCRGILGFYVVESHPKILQAWMPGNSARFMETLPIDQVTKSTIKLLRTFLAKKFPSIPDPIQVKRSTWFQNPRFRGSYSYRTLDSEKFNVWAKDLATPILNKGGKPIVMFAGEATHGNYFSTVHGAYDSGVREAKRIQEYYKN